MWFVFFLFFLLQTFTVIGQEYSFKKINNTASTPEVYLRCIALGPNNILYVGTNIGLYLFNGYEFKQVQSAYCKEKYIVSMYAFENQLYYATKAGLYMIENDTHRILYTCKKKQIIASIVCNKGPLVYFSDDDSLYSCKKENCAIISYSYPKNMLFINQLYLNKYNKLLVSSNNGLYTLSNNKLNLLRPEASLKIIHYKKDYLLNITPSTVYLYDSNFNELKKVQYRTFLDKGMDLQNSKIQLYAGFVDGKLLLISPLISHHLSPSNPLFSSKNLTGNVAVIIDLVGLKKEKEVDIPIEINNIVAIESNNLLCILASTFDLFSISKLNEHLFSFEPNRHPIDLIEKVDSNIIYTNFKDEVFTSNNLLKAKYTELFHDVNKIACGPVLSFNSYTVKGKKTYFATTINSGLFIRNNNTSFQYTTDSGFSSNTIMCYTKVSDTEIYMGTVAGVNVWNGQKVSRIYTESTLSFAFINDIKYYKGEVYIATNKGLYSVLHGIKNISALSNIDNEYFNSICFDKNDNMIASTFSNGIYYFDLINNNYVLKYHITKLDGLSSSAIYSIALDNEDRLFVSGKKSIDLVKRVGTTFQFYNISSLLPSKITYMEEMPLLKNDLGTILIGCNNGLLALYPNYILTDSSNQSIPTIYNVLINNEEVDWAKQKINTTIFGIPTTATFEYKNNNISFEYAAINYSSTKIYYEYYLEGLDKTWQPKTLDNIVNYRNLPYGKYTFKLRSVVNGLYSSVCNYSFTIKTPWWKTTLFYVTLLTLSCFLIWCIYTSKLKKIKEELIKKQEDGNLKYKLLSLQSSTLLNQFKPHFIFNAIAPLQKYIYTSDKQNALTYLTKFSGLMRLMLANARKDYNLLSEEIAFLHEYIQVQQIEHHYRFQYDIINNVLENNIYLPSIMVQPLIENCIEHGMASGNSGILNITFNKTTEKYIHVLISENGVGFDLMKLMSNNNNRALNILYDKINLYKTLPETNESNIDSYMQHGLFTIKLILPIKYNYED
jgi:hypothetical protein